MGFKFAKGSTSGDAYLPVFANTDNAGLITGTGTSLGAWTSYPPTLGGTGWAIGDGTVSGYYCKIGKVVCFKALITFGASSTFGSGALRISLPVTAAAVTSDHILLTQMADTSASSRYFGVARFFDTGNVSCFSNASPVAAVISTVPFTWATTDIVGVHGIYEAA